MATATIKTTPNPAVGMVVDTEAGQVAARHLLLSKIVPSKTNPRKIRRVEDDRELEESIRDDRVHQPILVRPTVAYGAEISWEVVAGQRRYEASKRAGKTTIPAVVRELTDLEAMKIQVIENDKRADLDPLDQALGYRNLFDEFKKSGAGTAKEQIDNFSRQLGKKSRTVYSILKLADLCAEGQALLRSNSINVTHCYEICRRTVASQQRIVQWIKLQMQDGSGPSVERLKTFIRQTCDLVLDGAPWKKDDAWLLPKAGACTNCQKNTDVNPEIDPDAKRATCTDVDCYEQKASLHLVQIEKLEKDKKSYPVVRISMVPDARPTRENHFIRFGYWKEVQPGTCVSSVKGLADPMMRGVIVDGDRKGHVINICFGQGAVSCKKHWPENYPTKPAKPSKDMPTTGYLKREAEQRTQDLQAAAKAREKEAIDREFQSTLLGQMIRKAKIDSWLIKGMVPNLIFDMWENQALEIDTFGQHVLRWPAPKNGLTYTYDEVKKHSESATACSEGLFAALLVLSPYLFSSLERSAGHFKIDARKLRKQVEQQAKERALAKKLMVPEPKTKEEKQLHAALYHRVGSEKVWFSLRRKGCTDSDLLKVMGEALALGGGIGSKELGSVYYKGGKDPSIWFNSMSDKGTPSLRGSALVAATRKLFNIGQPEPGTRTPKRAKVAKSRAKKKVQAIAKRRKK